ncbi:CDP-glycerol glycerophosphotransferase family protein [Sinorhizobium prairiense]|nr:MULTISPECIES: CDP-glycerol glycerophosphotransferase family protein [unclassified Sinorhizobium]WEJ12936.1 CDP-glycerol glycerophosphotransferase family protein [Sinorhizobium sp. M103]WEJ40030.1 CDP-glycerol glycerophosphotransferase family protein [Sinorhizobium sp. C101]
MMPRVLVTSTPKEFSSVTDACSGYRLTSREVRLIGIPRHDSLLSEGTSAKKDTIFIMPTWRQNLTHIDGIEKKRKVNSEFACSEYLARWKSFINSDKLRELGKEHCKSIVFCPHPNFADYIDAFEPPPWVSTVNALDTGSLQPYFARTSALITDYSSVAFDLAFLNSPVIYYQFDRNSFYAGHIYKVGYFDFDRDGFGPVSTEEAAALHDLEAALLGKEDTQFPARRRDTFPFRDGLCRERLYKEIEDLSFTPRA